MGLVTGTLSAAGTASLLGGKAFKFASKLLRGTKSMLGFAAKRKGFKLPTAVAGRARQLIGGGVHGVVQAMKKNPALVKQVALDAAIFGGLEVLSNALEADEQRALQAGLTPGHGTQMQEVEHRLEERVHDVDWATDNVDVLLTQMFHYAARGIREATLISQVCQSVGVRVPDLGLEMAASLPPADGYSDALTVIDTYSEAIQDEVGDEDPLTDTSADTPQEIFSRMTLLKQAANILGSVQAFKTVQAAVHVIESGDFDHYENMREVMG